MQGLHRLLPLLFLSPSITLAKTFVIASFWSMPTVHIYEELVARMYCKAGFDVQFQRVPMTRAQEDANAGVVDASLMHHPLNVPEESNLLPVPEPLPPLQMVYIALHSFPELELTAETQREYRVGHFPGSQALASDWWSPHSIAATGAYRQLQALLLARRIDVALVSYWDAPAILNEIREFRQVGSSVVTLPVYHYVNTRHRDILPLLAKALQELQESPGVAHLMAQARRQQRTRQDAAKRQHPIDCAEFQHSRRLNAPSPIRLSMQTLTAQSLTAPSLNNL